MAYTIPLFAQRAASTVIDPVPAPISTTVSSGAIRALTIIIARTSAFVIGTFPLINSSSLIPNVYTIPSPPIQIHRNRPAS